MEYVITMYSLEELKPLLRISLYNLAITEGLDVNTKTKKGELIEKLLEKEELPPMSVRIRRIYEASKGEKS